MTVADLVEGECDAAQVRVLQEMTPQREEEVKFQSEQYQIAPPRSISSTADPTFRSSRSSTRSNFILASILFSANHGTVVSCLNLATARLGSVGALSSAVLYLSYASSAVLGSTYIVKKIGSRNGLVLGMGVYCAYVGCFVVATSMPNLEEVAALTGAAVGGIGGGLLWTAQGSYFARTSEIYAEEQQSQGMSLPDSTSELAAIFASVYLAGEVLLNLLSTFLIEAFGLSWVTIFSLYTLISVVTAVSMHHWVPEYPVREEDDRSDEAALSKVTAALRLLVNDPKMVCMVPFCAVFGFAAAFHTSFTSGEVVRVALNDSASKYVGLLSSVTAVVAAVMSVVFGRLAKRTGKGTVLVIGALSFFMVAFPYLLVPDIHKWGWTPLLAVYTFQGIGRATFEGTLKAEFADFFHYEKEGAFANIVLQNGGSSAIGFFLSVSLFCSSPSAYCIEFTDERLHNVLAFELLVMTTAVLAVLGYWRAAALNSREQERNRSEEIITLAPQID